MITTNFYTYVLDHKQTLNVGSGDTALKKIPYTAVATLQINNKDTSLAAISLAKRKAEQYIETNDGYVVVTVSAPDAKPVATRYDNYMSFWRKNAENGIVVYAQQGF